MSASSLDLVKFVPVSTAVEPVIFPSSFNDYVSVRHLVTHTLAAKIRTSECFNMRKLLRDLEEPENHLWMSASSRQKRQNEKDEVPNLGSCTKIVPTNSPRRRRGPKVRRSRLRLDLRAPGAARNVPAAAGT